MHAELLTASAEQVRAPGFQNAEYVGSGISEIYVSDDFCSCSAQPRLHIMSPYAWSSTPLHLRCSLPQPYTDPEGDLAADPVAGRLGTAASRQR